MAPKTVTNDVALDRSASSALTKLRKLKADIAALDAERKACEAKLKAALGDKEQGTLRGKVVITYRKAIRSGVDLSVLKKAYADIARECTRDREVRTLLIVED
jgi:predicted phage-related endonuclease